MGERYTTLEELGSGGFGSVYKAHDTVLHRDVAIKHLDKGDGKDELREQLLREARVLATMQHPNIVSIYDVASKPDCDEIVMELLEGVSLNRLVKRHLLQPSDLKNVAGQILKALSSAHAAGVLHCDLKPENIMLCLAEDYYEAKVYDFGMSPTPGDEETKTKLLGSIYVMAPELFNGDPPSAQSDLYALGCVLYFLLVGEYPFLGDSSVQVMASHITGNYVSVTQYRSDLSPSFSLWLESLLNKDPAERVTDCKKALLELEQVEISQKEEELTLSTTFELEGNNSRLIRNISLDSLSEDGKIGDSQNSTAFLVNSFSHSSPVGERPKLPVIRITKAQSPIDRTDEPLLPEDAEWYFTVEDKVKGPVSLEQLTKLCHNGKVTRETLVWHSLLGDWVTAESCSETQAAFYDKQQKLDEEAARKEAELVQAEIEKRESDLLVKKEENSWLGPELWILFSAMLLTIVFCILNPDIRRYIISLYLFVVLAAGMSAARVCQIRQRAKWYSVIPVIGDLYYAIARPNTRNTLCSVMVIAGTIGMVIMSRGEAKVIENQYLIAPAYNSGFNPDFLKNEHVATKVPESKPEKTPVVKKLVKTTKPESKKKVKTRQYPTKLKNLRDLSGKAKTLKDL